jgi:hypothetical protein
VRVEGEAGIGYVLKPGFFLPPLMLTEDEAEAVLLGLDYVDQRGDDVLLKAGLNARAKIQAVLRSTVGSTASVRPSSPSPAVPPAFPGNAFSISDKECKTRDGNALFTAESLCGWDGDGVAGGQQAGEQCAESEQRGGCEQTACGKGALPPVGEDGAEKTVKGKTDDNARGRADQRDARGNPQDVRTSPRC